MAAQPQFNVGRDVVLVFIGPFGRIEIPNVTGWDAKPVIKHVKISPLNSPPKARDLPEGWDFTFTIERSGPVMDSLQALKEAAYWNGVTLPSESLFAYINEPDGSSTTWNFVDVTSHLEDAGAWAQEKAVTQKFKGFASQRVQVA